MKVKELISKLSEFNQDLELGYTLNNEKNIYLMGFYDWSKLVDILVLSMIDKIYLEPEPEIEYES